MSIEMLIDAEAAAEILHLHPKTVKRFAAAGVIPAMRIGKLWRFRASSLDAWAREQIGSNCDPRTPLVIDGPIASLRQSACHPFHQKEVER